MANSLAQITAEALSLSLEERSQLADRLFESIPHDENTPLSDAWMVEIKRRSQEIDDGMETYSAEEVFAELRRECA